MRKTVALVVGWLLAGVGAVTLATMAVGAVGDQLTDERPAALSATQVRAELDAAAATTSVAPPTTPPPPAPTTIDDRGGSGGADDRAASGGSTVTAPTTTTRPVAPSSTTKTFTLVGGTATLRFSSTGVTVITATPKGGYRVDIEPDHGNGVRVEFEDDGHRSRVTAWWDGGPQSDTREDTSGGGDGGSGGSGGGPG